MQYFIDISNPHESTTNPQTLSNLIGTLYLAQAGQCTLS
jgi:hypothetical protein